jgi:hypothetical protein
MIQTWKVFVLLLLFALAPSVCPAQKPHVYRLSGDVAECIVRRLTAREKCWDEESLRQCIRPLGGEFSPGLDEIRRVPVL